MNTDLGIKPLPVSVRAPSCPGSTSSLISGVSFSNLEFT